MTSVAILATLAIGAGFSSGAAGNLIQLGHIPQAFAVTADGKLFAVARDTNWIDVWDLPAGKRCQTVRCFDGDRVSVLAFSPDGKTLAAGATGTNLLRAWAADTGEERFAAAVSPGGTRGLAYSPDGKVLAAGGEDGLIRLCDPTTGRASAVLGERDGRPVTALALHPSGRLLAAATSFDPFGSVWRTEPPGRVRAFDGHAVAGETEGHSLAFSPDGRSLLAATGKGVRLLEVATCGVRWETPFGPPTVAVAVAPDGRWVACVSPSDGTVWLRDPVPGGARVPLRGHRAGVRGVAFAGQKLVTVGEDETVRVWDLPRRTPPALTRLAARRVDRLGDDLAGEDAAEAFRAIHELAGDPAAAVRLVRGRLRPVPPPGRAAAARVGELVADLGRDEFDVREAAARRLRALAPEVRTELLRARRAATDPEVTYRLDEVIRGAGLTADPGVGAARYLELLERVNTAEARAVAEGVAGGDPEAPLTRDAADTLARMSRAARVRR